MKKHNLNCYNIDQAHKRATNTNIEVMNVIPFILADCFTMEAGSMQVIDMSSLSLPKDSVSLSKSNQTLDYSTI